MARRLLKSEVWCLTESGPGIDSPAESQVGHPRWRGNAAIVAGLPDQSALDSPPISIRVFLNYRLLP